MERCNAADAGALGKMHSQMQAVNMFVAKQPTSQTKQLVPKRQEYVLTRRLQNILSTGSLLADSTKPSLASAYMAVGCTLCHAKLHLRCPYLGHDGFFDPDVVAAMNRHVVQFLWNEELAQADAVTPGTAGSFTSCTAELAYKGCKHASRAGGLLTDVLV